MNSTAFFGKNLTLYNALTDHPVAVKPEISYETYHTIDIMNVDILAVATCMPALEKTSVH